MTPVEWYELGCQFTEMSMKLDKIHILLLNNLPDNYCIKVVDKTREYFDIILRNELTEILFKEFPKNDHLPEFGNLLLMDVFYYPVEVDQTINYGSLKQNDEIHIIQLCHDVINYIDQLYIVYGNKPVLTLNKIIINMHKIIRNINKLNDF